MAAGTLPAPGTTYGPCEGDCAHQDCARTREMAATPCATCSEPIGYGRRFFDVTPIGSLAGTDLEHETCAFRDQ